MKKSYLIPIAFILVLAILPIVTAEELKMPDLVIEKIEFSLEPLIPTYNATITLTIKNQGDAPADCTGKKIGYYIYSSPAFAPISADAQDLGVIGVDETKIISTEFQTASPGTGQYRVGAAIDTLDANGINHAVAWINPDGTFSDVDLTNGTINESNEINNRLMSEVTVSHEASALEAYLEKITPKPKITSPTTQEIAFATCSDPADIWVINADGTNAVPVTDDGGQRKEGDVVINTDYSFPSWSPDGKYIAYLIREYASEPVHTGRYEQKGDIEVEIVDSRMLYDKYGIGILDVSNLNKRVLLFSEELATSDFLPNRIVGRPSWSPNSQEIAFVAWGSIQNIILGDDALRTDHVYRIKTDGTNLNLIMVSATSSWDSFVKTYMSKGLFHISSVAWSPDGSKIAFDKRFHLKDNVEYLWTADIDGSNQRQLTIANGGRNPDWTCDGAWLVYESETAEDPYQQIAKTHLDGTQNTMLERGENPSVSSTNDIVFLKTHQEPVYSSVTKEQVDITYSSDQLYTMDFSGASLQKITSSEQFFCPPFTPDWKKPC